jgi:hypothetical protein
MVKTWGEKGMLWERNSCFDHLKFEMPISHPSTDGL